MKKIQLGGHRYKNNPVKGYALVDDKDYKWLSQWEWYLTSGGYAARKSINGIIYMHRLILKTPKKLYSDHINGDRLDNQRKNLRICTNQQNTSNQKKKKGSSTYKGVYWNKECKKWVAQITKNYKIINIGLFKKEHHAAMCYDLNAKAVFGEYAKLNFN